MPPKKKEQKKGEKTEEEETEEEKVDGSEESDEEALERLILFSHGLLPGSAPNSSDEERFEPYVDKIVSRGNDAAGRMEAKRKGTGKRKGKRKGTGKGLGPPSPWVVLSTLYGDTDPDDDKGESSTTTFVWPPS